MFAYKGVLHAGKYYAKPIVKHCNLKDTKIKLKQLLNEQRRLKYSYSRIRKFYKGT